MTKKEEVQESTSTKLVSWSHLAVVVLSVFALGCKVYYDVNANHTRLEAQQRVIEQSNAISIENDKEFAVISAQLEAIRRQNTALIIKLDDVYKMILKRGP